MGFLSDLAKGVVSSVVGGHISSAFSSRQQQQQANLQYDNWARMQRNAHQLEVQDLKDAGLNPILSATNSQMASAPAAPSATIQAGAGLPGYITSAMKAQLENEVAKGRLDNERTGLQIRAEELKLRDREVAYKEAESAQHRELMERQMDEIDNRIAISIADLDIRKRLADADIEVKKEAAYELGARAQEAIARSSMTLSQKAEIDKRIKYGAFIATYLPQEVGDYVYSNLVTWIDGHKEQIDELIQRGFMSTSESERRQLIKDILGAYADIKE